MPTIFSHAVFAAAAGRAFVSKPVSRWFWLLTAVCAMVPDADVAGFAFGVRYNEMLGHRGLTHSLTFAILFGGAVALVVRRFLPTGLSLWQLVIYFSLATLSHPLLDMLTDGGLGVALFAPFSNERCFFPWRPVEVSPIGAGFFSRRGLVVILSEFVWIWLPALAILAAAAGARKFSGKR
jgi:inner membrane protein